MCQSEKSLWKSLLENVSEQPLFTNFRSEDTLELKAQKLEGKKYFLIIGHSWIQGAINIIKVAPNSAYSFFIPPETYSKISKNVIVKKIDFKYILSFFFIQFSYNDQKCHLN